MTIRIASALLLAGGLAATSIATQTLAQTEAFTEGSRCVYSEDLPKAPPQPSPEPPRFNHQRTELALASAPGCPSFDLPRPPGRSPTAQK